MAVFKPCSTSRLSNIYHIASVFTDWIAFCILIAQAKNISPPMIVLSLMYLSKRIHTCLRWALLNPACEYSNVGSIIFYSVFCISRSYTITLFCGWINIAFGHSHGIDFCTPHLIKYFYYFCFTVCSHMF